MISSDLSHYEPYERTREHDAATAAAIEGLDGALGPRDACGWLPIGGPARRAARRGMRVARLDLRSSGDTAGRGPGGRLRRLGVLRDLERRPAMSVRLFAGASGFSYKPWKGPFYPADLPDAEMLGYYAARLPAVEINNTFYRLPKAKMLEDWAGQTPDGFRFVLKASRRITHIQRLKDVGELLGYLFETAGALGPKLGRLFQLPPHLKKDLDRLGTFLDLVPPERRVALEFRNASWFEDDVFEALRAHDAALCVAETEP